MNIIPAIDIIDGQCVRLTKGDYTTKKIYDSNPVDQARAFEDHGIQYLHLVDLDGAKTKQIKHLHILEAITTNTKLRVDFGGGIQTDQDIINALNAGAQQVTIGSIAVQNRDLFLRWLTHFGADKLILGADCKKGEIVADAWTATSAVAVVPFIQQYEQEGLRYCMVTDIDKDGMLKGPSLNLYKHISAQSSVKLIASGGVSSMTHLHELKQVGCHAAILGKAIYENRITLKELSTLC